MLVQKLPPATQAQPYVAASTVWLRAPMDGIWRPLVELGYASPSSAWQPPCVENHRDGAESKFVLALDRLHHVLQLIFTRLRWISLNG